MTPAVATGITVLPTFWHEPTTWLAVFILLSIAQGLLLGRDRLIMLILSLYLALALITNVPVFSSLNQALRLTQSPLWQIAGFFIFFLLVFWLLSRSRLLETLAQERGEWWEAVLLSFLEIGLIISISLLLLAAKNLFGWPATTLDIFLSDGWRSFWLLAPIVAIAGLDVRASLQDEGRRLD